MNKHFVIVGGTKGIGRTFVKSLRDTDSTVSVVARKKPIGQEFSYISFFKVDLIDKNQIESACKNIVNKNGKINYLIFFQRFRGEGDSWNGEMAVSLEGTKEMIEKLKGHFRKDEDKSIIITSSLASTFIHSEQPLSYHLGKAGINQMIRYYAVVLGSCGIRVNATCSGTIIKEEAEEFYKRNRRLQNVYKKIIPLRRMGKANDVSNLISFLCSPRASFITGQSIIIDGGTSLLGHESLARHLTSLDRIPITKEAARKSKGQSR